MYEILKFYLNYHAEALHKRISGHSAAIPPFNSIPDRSGYTFPQEHAKQDAHMEGIATSSNAVPIENILETAVGKQRAKRQDYDAERRLKEYKRSKTDARRDETVPSKTTGRRTSLRRK